MKRRLESTGALLIEGAKWCGKTTSAEQVAKKVVRFNDPDAQPQIQAMLEVSPRRLLAGDTPVLLDEWQLQPTMWDAVRFEVDRRGEPGQFILTGSAVPADPSQLHHSGAGRIARVRMRPMSLYESGESIGTVSLQQLFSGEPDVEGNREMGLDELAFIIARGGWPASIDMSKSGALQHARDYYDAIVHTDISRVDGVRRSADKASTLMQSYARVVGTSANFGKIIADMKVITGISLSVNSVASYISALKDIFIIEEMTNWTPRLRIRAALRTSPIRYFTDPSIAAAALRAGPKELIDDLPTMGLLFENMVMRDLRIYMDRLRGEVHHYLNAEGLEVDAILRLHDGKYGLVEVKLGLAGVEQGAASLKKFAESVDTQHSPAPSFLMVIVGVASFPYRRKDGVFVVPVSTLAN